MSPPITVRIEWEQAFHTTISGTEKALVTIFQCYLKWEDSIIRSDHPKTFQTPYEVYTN